MAEFIEVDLSEVLNGLEIDHTFDFDEELRRIDAADPNYGNLDGEVCRFFLRGNCAKGSSCPYKHIRNEKTVVCKHWLRSLCKKGEQCEFLHQYDLSKMPECFFFTKYGECSNPECVYLHINPDDKIQECSWYARGFCKHGPRCRMKHIRKIACESFLLGFCSDGPNCKFGHPKYELPKEEDKRLAPPPSRADIPSAGHNFGDRMPIGKRPLDQVMCYKCGQTGHYANKCPNKDAPGLAAGGAPVPWTLHTQSIQTYTS